MRKEKARWQTASDYISIKDDSFWQILFDEACVEGKQAERIQKELEKIALDEKEIIRKAFKRVVERLEELQSNSFDDEVVVMDEAIEIVKEECGIHE